MLARAHFRGIDGRFVHFVMGWPLYVRDEILHYNRIRVAGVLRFILIAIFPGDNLVIRKSPIHITAVIVGLVFQKVIFIYGLILSLAIV